MIDNRPSKSKVRSLLTLHQFGRNYLLKALDSSSEIVFLEALHYVVDAISQEIDSTSVNHPQNKSKSH
jgi:hypothetical protein